jgi:protein phosphatase
MLQRAMKIAATTDVGRVRELNEDTVWTRVFAPGVPNPWGLEALLMVADGMGGHRAGEVASSLACETARRLFAPNDLNGKGEPEEARDGPSFLRRAAAAVQEINRVVHEYSAEPCGRQGSPGTTLTLALLRHSEYFIAHVGDSRAYFLRAGSPTVEQVTEDDSFVGEAVRRGHMTAEEANSSPLRHQITKAIGLEPCVEPSVYYGHWTTGDVLLLCSDGLTEHVNEDDIAKAVQQSADLPSACVELAALANERGGSDNISIAAACNDLAHSEADSESEEGIPQKTLTEVSAQDVAQELSRLSTQDGEMAEFLALTNLRHARRARQNTIWRAGITLIAGVVIITATLGYRAQNAIHKSSIIRTFSASLPQPGESTTATSTIPAYTDIRLELKKQNRPTLPFHQQMVVRWKHKYELVLTASQNKVDPSPQGACIEINSPTSFDQLGRDTAHLELREYKDAGNARVLRVSFDKPDEMGRTISNPIPLVIGREYSLLYLSPGKGRPREMARIKMIASDTPKEGHAP